METQGNGLKLPLTLVVRATRRSRALVMNEPYARLVHESEKLKEGLRHIDRGVHELRCGCRLPFSLQSSRNLPMARTNPECARK